MTARHVHVACVGVFLAVLVELVLAGVHQVDVARTEDHVAAIAAYRSVADRLDEKRSESDRSSTALNAEEGARTALNAVPR